MVIKFSDLYQLSFMWKNQNKISLASGNISGRSSEDLDNLFSPLKFNAGGQHGLELRKSGEKNKQTVNTNSFN